MEMKMSQEIDFIWEEEQFSNLEFIANQCPYVVGKVAQQARGLLQLINPEFEFDDEILCHNTANFQKHNDDIHSNAGLKNRSANENADFKLHPNPANTLVTITGQLEGLHLNVFDIYGRSIQTLILQDTQHSIDVSQLPIGVYQLKLQNELGVLIFEEKLIVTR